MGTFARGKLAASADAKNVSVSGSGQVSFGGFAESERHKSKAVSTDNGVRTSSESSDLTATASGGAAPSYPDPSEFSQPTAGGGGSVTSPGSGYWSGDGNVTGSATASNATIGVQTLKRDEEAGGHYAEYGVFVSGSLARSKLGDILESGGSGSLYGGSFSSSENWDSSSKYNEWMVGGGGSSATGFTNGNLVVAADSLWVGGYSLNSKSNDDYSGEDQTYGVSASGTVKIAPLPSGTGEFQFFKRSSEESGDSEQTYDGAGVLTRGGSSRGGKLVTTSTSSGTAGGYSVTDKSKSRGSYKSSSYTFGASGSLDGSSLDDLSSGTIGVGGQGGLHWGKSKVEGSWNDSGESAEAGGASSSESSKVSGASGESAGQYGSASRSKNSSTQIGSYTESGKSHGQEESSASSGYVSVWGSGGVGLGGVSAGSAGINLTLGGGSVSGGWSRGGAEGASSVVYDGAGSASGDRSNRQSYDSGPTGGKPHSESSSSDNGKTYSEGLVIRSDTGRNESSYQTTGRSVSFGFDVGLNYDYYVPLPTVGVSATTTKSSSSGENSGRSRTAERLFDWNSDTFTSKTKSVDGELSKQKSYQGREYGRDEYRDSDWGTDSAYRGSSSGGGYSSDTSGSRHTTGGGRHDLAESGKVSTDGNNKFPGTFTVSDTGRGTSTAQSASSYSTPDSSGNYSSHANTSGQTSLAQNGRGEGATFTFASSDHADGGTNSSATFPNGGSSSDSQYSSDTAGVAYGGPGGVTGSTSYSWSNSGSWSSTYDGETSSDSWSNSGSNTVDSPPYSGMYGGYGAYGGYSYYNPQAILSPGQIWAGAVVGVYNDLHTMFTDGATFGQISSLHARAKSLGSEYGPGVYYTMFAAGAATPALIVAAATAASGGSLTPLWVGAGLGAGFAGARQGAEMLDGARAWGDFDYSQVVGGAGMGALFGAVNRCVVPAVVSNAAKYAFAAQGISGGLDALGRGERFTGAFDLVTAGLPFLLGRSCFVAGTPVRTPGGSVPVEKLRPGDLVLSRDEFDPAGPVVAKAVEEVFRRYTSVWELSVGGRVVGTTGEHPFYSGGAGLGGGAGAARGRAGADGVGGVGGS